MNFFSEMQKIDEAYCLEHNLPCKRHFTHAELANAIQAVRNAEAAKRPIPAEAATELGANFEPDDDQDYARQNAEARGPLTNHDHTRKE
jgi:hypothetical protein